MSGGYLMVHTPGVISMQISYCAVFQFPIVTGRWVCCMWGGGVVCGGVLYVWVCCMCGCVVCVGVLYVGVCCMCGCVLYVWVCVVCVDVLYVWVCCMCGCVVCVGVLYVWMCCMCGCVVCVGVLYVWVCCMCGCVVCGCVVYYTCYLLLLSLQIFREAKRMAPSIIYIPRMGSWWEVTTDTFRETFLALVHALPSSSPVLILATSEQPVDQLPDDLKELFSGVSY